MSSLDRSGTAWRADRNTSRPIHMCTYNTLWQPAHPEIYIPHKISSLHVNSHKFDDSIGRNRQDGHSVTSACQTFTAWTDPGETSWTTIDSKPPPSMPRDA